MINFPMENMGNGSQKKTKWKEMLHNLFGQIIILRRNDSQILLISEVALATEKIAKNFK